MWKKGSEVRGMMVILTEEVLCVSGLLVGSLHKALEDSPEAAGLRYTHTLVHPICGMFSVFFKDDHTVFPFVQYRWTS